MPAGVSFKIIRLQVLKKIFRRLLPYIGAVTVHVTCTIYIPSQVDATTNIGLIGKEKNMFQNKVHARVNSPAAAKGNHIGSIIHKH